MTCAALISCLLLAGPADDKDKDASVLVGTWNWTWKDAQGTEHKHVLEVEGSGDKIAAREVFDDGEPVKVTDLKKDGKTVTFSVKRDKKLSSYKGEMKSKELIEGMVSVSTDGQAQEFGWEAKKASDEKKKKK